MNKCMVIDSEYCSMGRWISVIVGATCNMKLYEGKDLVALANEEWLTEEYLQDFDERIATMTVEQARNNEELKKVHSALSKAIVKAIEIGPCIIHERAAASILENKADILKVLLYNTKVEHKIPRARTDKTYPLENLSNTEIIAFMEKEDRKRSNYHNAVAKTTWGSKETYDICLDSDILSREKCAEILIEALQAVSLDLEACQKAIDTAFTWTK